MQARGDGPLGETGCGRGGAVVRNDPGENRRESTGGRGSGSRNGSSMSSSQPSIVLKVALLHLMASLSS